MAKTHFKVILPRMPITNAAAVKSAVLSALDKFGTGIQRDFRGTTKGWKTKVRFTKEAGISGDAATVEVGTDNAIYNYVSHGTPPHMIYPRRGKVLRYPHPGGGIWFSKFEHHPGIKARNFAQSIAARHRGQLAGVVQVAIASAVGKG